MNSQDFPDKSLFVMYTSLISILICEENERQKKKTTNFKFGHILTSRYANSFEEIEPALFRLIYGVLRELFGRRLSPNWTPPIWSFNLFHRIVSCALIWQQRPLPYELCAICRISNGWQDAQNCQINNFNYNFFPFFGFVSWTFQDKFFPPVFGTYEILIVSDFLEEESSKSWKVGIFLLKHNWSGSLSTV